MTLPDLGALGEIIQGLASLGVLAIAAWTGWVAVRQLRISATTDLFHRFNDPSARDQRRWVYHHCSELTEPERLPTWAKQPEALNYLESVCNSLDWAVYWSEKDY